MLVFDLAGAALITGHLRTLTGGGVGFPGGQASAEGLTGRLGLSGRGQSSRAGNELAVSQLLDRRARAVLARDRAEFLSTVDPRDTRLRSRQRALFDNLAQVPLETWEYQLDDGDAFQLPPERRAALAGGDPAAGASAFGAQVRFRYRLAGYDTFPVGTSHYLTFVRRAGLWYLAGDDDGAGSGRRTGRELWDFGPVAVRRGKASLVLGLEGGPALARYAADADRSVPAVTKVWGQGWARRVVLLVPRTQTQMATLLGASPEEYAQIAAVTTGELGVQTARGGAAERVIINPGAFRQLGPVGRRVVMTHEATHVATRAVTRPWTPTWLAEGFADYAGYLDSGVPTRAAITELSRDVRAGRTIAGLPVDDDFTTTRTDLAQAYEKGWLACRFIAERYGRDALVEFYRAVGAGPPGEGRGDPTGEAFAQVLGVSEAEFVTAWRDYVEDLSR
jgi:hypothetical protein